MSVSQWRRVLPACLVFTLHPETATSEIQRIVSSLDGKRLNRETSIPWRDNGDVEHEAVRVTVDAQQHFQTMRGFGASVLESGAINLNTLPAAKQVELLDKLFSESGAHFSALKAPIPSDDFFAAGPWYTYDDFPGDVNLTKISIERDLKPNGTLNFVLRAKKHGFSGYVQSYMDYPPDWMLKGHLPDNATLDTKYYSTMANYFAKFVEAYQQHGVTIDYLSMFNEPVDSYTNISAPEMAELLGHHVGPTFDELGLTQRTKLTSAGQCSRQSAGQMVPSVMAHHGALKYMNHIAFHGYDCQFNCSKQRQNYDVIADLHRRWPQLEMWMTEVCYAYNGDDPNCKSAETMINCTDWPRNHSLAPPLPRLDFEDGRIWGSRIASDVAAGVSGWIYWNLILDMEGGPFLYSPSHNDNGANLQQAIVHVDRMSGKYMLTGLFWYLAHFSKFVRPGMTRVYTQVHGYPMPTGYVAEGTVGVEAVSFSNSTHVVSQLMNHDLKANLIYLQSHGKSATIRLPPASITTAIWRNTDLHVASADVAMVV